ncbi:hypothetical protein [Frankia sp. QA3]|uniref:hypothetical protein n=1 Tax=Frankia sp. QA3 TaxID=710111 RepID=UPI000269BEFE|nr:hypothetical protein [Frankia sp. QA3]EIV92714.1 hypothetical protein FraQA3DRAFT_2324 [Frankia sp. QA3]
MTVRTFPPAGRFPALSTGAPVDVEFPAEGGTVPLRLTLTAAAPVADATGTTRLGVDLDLVSLTIKPLDHEVAVPVPPTIGKVLAADLDIDQEVRRVRIFDLSLPRHGDTLYAFADGDVRVETPRQDGDPQARTSVRAVLSAGPRGAQATPPTRGFPGFGPPDAARLYGDQLPCGSTRGTPAQITLDCGAPVRGGRVELRFCTGDDPLHLAPVTVSARAEVVRSAPPRGLRLTVGPASSPVLAWQHDPPLTAPDAVELVPVLGALLDKAASAPGPVTVDASLTCAVAAKVRLVLSTRGAARTRGRYQDDPARVALAGAGGVLAAGVVGDPVAATATARLTGSAGPVRRTAASPSPLADPARTGTVVTDTRYVARRLDATALEARPLVRVGVLAAAVAGELVVELRADAGGPGPVLAPGGVTAVNTHAVPAWWTVEIPPLRPGAVPAAGCWIVARTNAGRLLWADGDPPGETMTSEDGGRSWYPAQGRSPALALFVDDPGGAVPPLLARIGTVTSALLPEPGAAFDSVVTWPAELRQALPTAAAAHLDCARDLRLEVVDLRVSWTATLSLGRA